MNISLSSISNLIKLIRSQSNLDNIIKHHQYGEIYYELLLNNEIYFLKKLNDEKYTKVQFYEDNIIKKNVEMFYSFENCKKKTFLDFDNHLIKSIQLESLDYIYEIEDVEKYKNVKLDPFFNGAKIWRDVYLGYQIPSKKMIYSELITNSFYEKYNISNFNAFISEAIFTNIIQFNNNILDEEKFINYYFQLLYAQNKKNLERIEKTDNLKKEKEEILINYGPVITKYLFTNVMFSISDFVEKNNISYNTGKKYLKKLVDKKILKAVKVGKHNAFVFVEIFQIWSK